MRNPKKYLPSWSEYKYGSYAQKTDFARSKTWIASKGYLLYRISVQFQVSQINFRAPEWLLLESETKNFDLEIGFFRRGHGDSCVKKSLNQWSPPYQIFIFQVFQILLLCTSDHCWRPIIVFSIRISGLLLEINPPRTILSLKRCPMIGITIIFFILTCLMLTTREAVMYSSNRCYASISNTSNRGSGVELYDLLTSWKARNWSQTSCFVT